MSLRLSAVWMSLLGLCACAGGGVKSVEVLDERTGASVAALHAPLEFVQSGSLLVGHRSSFAYLGPLELNEMGKYRYLVWLHVAPGTGKAVADLRSDAVVTLVLADGAQVLQSAAAPLISREPYSPVVAWGQTAYFSVTAAQLRHLAASAAPILQLRGVDGTPIQFRPSSDTRAVLTEFVQARGLTAD